MILDSEECFSVPINIFFILRRVPFSSISLQRCHLNELVKSKEEMATKRMTELNPWPSYIQDRIELWDKFHEKYKQQLAEKQLDTIKITLPNGQVLDGQAWCTTPYQIAQEISQDLADNAVVAKVDDVLWDLDRPLESSCDLQLLNFDCEEGQQVFWHSSAHIVGEAMERVYGGWLCCGPPIDSGFYYDMYLEDRCISSSDFPFLQNVIKSIVKEKQPFERLELPKEDLLEMFKYNPFKVYTLKEKVKTPTTTVYRCGPMIDLCCGPHVRHTGKVKALQITKNSSTYWEENNKVATLQRIYGISFPKIKWLKEWQKFQETAVKKDHRKIGKEQELFFFHELSPGSCFFQPLGTLIYNNLLDFIRSEYRKRGFQEVISPNIFNCKLWKTSGHWPYYSENMFSFEFEKVKYALKPMNCPGHCLMFDHRPRSWRELPLRMADFGVLHRNEFSGTLSGLMRVRRFQQDDAHIFCAVNQIAQEIEGALSFLQDVYSVFGFTFQLKLATRPDYFLGELDMWNQAEKQLQESLENFGQQWTLNPGDGAFYGPKIDITIMDALKRPHQCATIQLDFQLPVRFNLFYISESGEKKQPVIIHRAVLGSVERMIAILAENFGGRWPFWLSPRQAIVVSVGPMFDDYAKQVRDEIRNGGFLCEVDLDEGTTLSKKIRNAQLAQFNYIFVVGEREKTSETVNVRTRDNRVHGEYSLTEVMKSFKKLKDQKVINSEDVFQT